MKKMTLLLLTVLALLLPAGCAKQQESVPPKQVRIAATAAYEKYFGPAPTTDKGTCFAFVIYFPLAKAPGKVVPFPFFTFDEGSIKKVAVERLLSGMDVGSYRGEFVPFPGGTHLIAINDNRGTVTANISKELNASSEAAAQAIVLTLRQFTGVKDVRLQVEGRESPLSAIANKADDRAVQQPSPPRLLSVTAIREKGSKDIEEVNAFFDRPVEIKKLKLLSGNGKPLSGDTYHSVFDMAAVLKPKVPGMFKERMPIRVLWEVADKLGRHSEGDEVRLLEVKEQ